MTVHAQNHTPYTNIVEEAQDRMADMLEAFEAVFNKDNNKCQK
jgi:hypothetical protein